MRNDLRHLQVFMVKGAMGVVYKVLRNVMTPREPKRSCMVGRMVAIAMAVLLVCGTPFTVARSAEDAA
jgi:uncharacterized membrane protein